MNKLKLLAQAAALLPALAGTSRAALSFFVEPNNPWPGGWYDAAVANMQATVNMYNAYGDFGNGNIYVYYNSGIPTAQSGWGGSGGAIGVGGSYPSFQITLHESAHWLGTGTYSNNWFGPATTALMEQFDGIGARLNGDTQHFWPYGENYGNESSPINDRRHVAIVYALRKDFGIGSTAPPSSAKAVTLMGSDAPGDSGFNTPWQWSDAHFAQPGTDYYTGNYAIRTPNGVPSWTFVGDSLTVNNRGNTSGGLLFNGYGTTGVVTIKNLILDGGSVKHDQFPQDLFQLAGKVTVVSPSIFRATNGNIDVLSSVSGQTTLTIDDSAGGYRVRFLSNANSFKGNIDVMGRFELADNANLKFVVRDAHTNNAITGAGADAILLDGDFQFDLSRASANIGDSWSIVSAANVTYGNDFTVVGFNHPSASLWTNAAGYSFSQATGQLTFGGAFGIENLPEPAALGAAVAGLTLLRRQRRACGR